MERLMQLCSFSSAKCYKAVSLQAFCVLQLTSLRLDGNGLTGTLPSSFGNLAQVWDLLSSNLFTQLIEHVSGRSEDAALAYSLT